MRLKDVTNVEDFIMHMQDIIEQIQLIRAEQSLFETGDSTYWVLEKRLEILRDKLIRRQKENSMFKGSKDGIYA